LLRCKSKPQQNDADGRQSAQEYQVAKILVGRDDNSVFPQSELKQLRVARCGGQFTGMNAVMAGCDKIIAQASADMRIKQQLHVE